MPVHTVFCQSEKIRHKERVVPKKAPPIPLRLEAAVIGFINDIWLDNGNEILKCNECYNCEIGDECESWEVPTWFRNEVLWEEEGFKKRKWTIHMP